ncbi:hypothetical protein [Acetoanaerobium sticklandii]|uniref:hypothetical protein n=1 Tax=Acetoanaerobium sticklandii TaxID=1511 RepID=UPI003A8D0EBE
MSEERYKKTYKPLIAWMISFPIILTIPSIFLNKFSEKIEIVAILAMIMLSVYVLILIIYHGEYVYWINGGPSFKEAKEASSEVRKEYARAHLEKFKNIFIKGFIYLIFSLVLNLSIWIDIVVVSLMIIVAAIKTMPIKFKN